ncbi:hypothetical protein I4F81_004847 [Pyropia yezoensis]|uniref:Uncharacterized protein n=1 Tax=Pyropia yezoensis TaxID=2788 RepID=A0ACC3BXD2_PYRYE|nr:hypothetical protein I4F81_004847 [Neopyropia yezoensis]
MVSEMTELQATLASGDDLLYGTAPVLAALRAGRRSRFEVLYVRGEEGGGGGDRGRDRGGERGGGGGASPPGASRKADGTEAGREIRRLARVRQVPVRAVAKGDLNVLCGSRPHQGYVLQAAPLEWVSIKALPPLTGRSALTATVSKASAGAMEAFPLHSVGSMPRLLATCRADGWRVVGTALVDGAVAATDLPRDVPTVVVMGSEGHGLRPLVQGACDVLVRIGGRRATGGGEVYEVDSLNVSVAAGVVLHQLLGE